MNQLWEERGKDQGVDQPLILTMREGGEQGGPQQSVNFFSKCGKKKGRCQETKIWGGGV